MKIIVGLGNPGKEYLMTRHNIGWRVVSPWIENAPEEKKFSAQYKKEGDLVYCIPHTFMNRSGVAVRAIMDWYGCSASDVIIIYDDIDIPFGKIRIRSTGSAGGHNGMRSVIEHLGTNDIARVRIGIAPEANAIPLQSFVLQRFSEAEEEKLQIMLPAIRTHIMAIVEKEIFDTSIHLDSTVL